MQEGKISLLSLSKDFKTFKVLGLSWKSQSYKIPLSHYIAIVFDFGLTEIDTIGDVIDFNNTSPFFFSLSISSKSFEFNKVILASLSITMKS